jgi:hypothetical protein
MVRLVLKRRRSAKNPNYCDVCETFVRAHPGGAEVEISMLFADVRGSTTLAEQMRPIEFSRLMNRFYDRANRVVIDRTGSSRSTCPPSALTTHARRSRPRPTCCAPRPISFGRRRRPHGDRVRRRRRLRLHGRRLHRARRLRQRNGTAGVARGRGRGADHRGRPHCFGLRPGRPRPARALAEGPGGAARGACPSRLVRSLRQSLPRVNVRCVTPLGEETGSIS